MEYKDGGVLKTIWWLIISWCDIVAFWGIRTIFPERMLEPLVLFVSAVTLAKKIVGY